MKKNLLRELDGALKVKNTLNIDITSLAMCVSHLGIVKEPMEGIYLIDSFEPLPSLYNKDGVALNYNEVLEGKHGDEIVLLPDDTSMRLSEAIDRGILIIKPSMSISIGLMIVSVVMTLLTDYRNESEAKYVYSNKVGYPHNSNHMDKAIFRGFSKDGNEIGLYDAILCEIEDSELNLLTEFASKHSKDIVCVNISSSGFLTLSSSCDYRVLEWIEDKMTNDESLYG